MNTQIKLTMLTAKEQQPSQKASLAKALEGSVDPLNQGASGEIEAKRFA